MTEEGEAPRVPQYPEYPQQPSMPRLFSDAEDLAGEGAGAGGDGVGIADDGDPGASGLPGGAHPGSNFDTSLGDDELGSLLDGDLGVRGARPASRSELAELIMRYRDEQASRRARRRVEETRKPRFSSEQRLLILDSWLRSKLSGG